MLSLEEYKQNPCGLLSVPYWKAKTLCVPDGMKIVHDRAFSADSLQNYSDEPYFRLFHSLENIIGACPPEISLVTAVPADTDTIVSVINRSYCDIQVDRRQIEAAANSRVHRDCLWILALASGSGGCAGCGIADFDGEAKEASLEWIQVLPEYRRRGIGTAIVTELLRRAQPFADFATVSGKIGSKNHPETLYRKCGFTGGDVWHVLRAKPEIPLEN